MPVRRILFADNDPDFLNTRAEFLENEGYQVLRAFTLEETRQLLTEAHAHLAILDIRMMDDDDERDTSGLTLAKDPALRPVPKIILTGFPSYQYVREALGPALDGLPPAVDFLSKKEGPEAMIQAVERAFAQHVRINWDLVIRWDERERLSFPHLVTLIEPDLDSTRLPDRAGELEDLFRKLFHEKSQITIGQLLWHREGRGCVMVFTFSPEGVSEPLVITCGLRPRMKQEIARCEKFAPKGGTATALLTSAETMHFAAVAYTLPKADLEQVQTFEAFYWTNKSSQIRAALEHLFQSTLAPWHQGGRILEETKSLGQLYRQCLNLSQEGISQQEFRQRIQTLAREALSLGPTMMELSAHELALRFPNGDTVSYPNPIPHVYEEAAGGGPPVVCCMTPGTLTGDNILVDQNGQTWLTDFAQAGPAPLLWDFVSLEATIRLNLVESADLQALHEFEKRLVTPTRLNRRLDTQDIDPQFRKALGVIQEIRRLAFSSAGGDPIPYYEGLLFRAISDVAGYAPDIRYTSQELARPVHALLAAAMIWGKITQMAEEPSPGGSPPAARGIEIDEASRQVRVEGRRVALSPSEFDLLLYLYNHAGQLCTRRSIVEEGLEGKYLENRQEASRINTIMGRLRKKMEPDPDDPRYILTVRGEGYMLCLGDEERS
jgi:DNA-binding response OmpR family regulator